MKRGQSYFCLFSLGTWALKALEAWEGDSFISCYWQAAEQQNKYNTMAEKGLKEICSIWLYVEGIWVPPRINKRFRIIRQTTREQWETLFYNFKTFSSNFGKIRQCNFDRKNTFKKAKITAAAYAWTTNVCIFFRKEMCLSYILQADSLTAETLHLLKYRF